MDTSHFARWTMCLQVPWIMSVARAAMLCGVLWHSRRVRQQGRVRHWPTTRASRSPSGLRRRMPSTRSGRTGMSWDGSRVGRSGPIRSTRTTGSSSTASDSARATRSGSSPALTAGCSRLPGTQSVRFPMTTTAGSARPAAPKRALEAGVLAPTRFAVVTAVIIGAGYGYSMAGR